MPRLGSRSPLLEPFGKQLRIDFLELQGRPFAWPSEKPFRIAVRCRDIRSARQFWLIAETIRLANSGKEEVVGVYAFTQTQLVSVYILAAIEAKRRTKRRGGSLAGYGCDTPS